MEGSLRILVADDEDSIRDVTTRALAGPGRECESARDGEEALQKLSKGRFDLLVTDIKMPKMTGDKLVAEARKLSADLQIIMMTGFPELETAREAIRQGVYEYLQKPFDLEDLKNSARRALDTQRLARENKAYQLELEARYIKLMEYERTRNNLIGLVAEDLRSPLSKAVLNLEILDEGLSGALSADQAKIVALSREAVRRSLSVAGDLADLRLAEQDDLFVAKADLVLADLLEEKFEKALAMAKDDGKDMELKVEGGKGPIRGDEGLISRVLDNALIFSLRHTDRGGKVLVSLKSGASQVEAVFEGGDQGVPPGLSGTALSRILASEPESTGLDLSEALSLAFCWNAVEAHGGRATLDRPSPGRSRFKMALPARRVS